MTLQVSLVGSDLVIVNVSRADAGTYTCELDTDDLTPLAVSHTLQILGGCQYEICLTSYYSDSAYIALCDALWHLCRAIVVLLGLKYGL